MLLGYEDHRMPGLVSQTLARCRSREKSTCRETPPTHHTVRACAVVRMSGFYLGGGGETRVCFPPKKTCPPPPKLYGKITQVLPYFQ